MQVPAHYQATAKALGLRSWVHGKKFPMDEYAETIQGGVEILKRHAPEGEELEIEDKQIAGIVARALDAEGALLDHVLNTAKQPIPDEPTWTEMCEAAGWVVLQRYALIQGKGED